MNQMARTASKIMQPNEDVGMNGQMGLPQTWWAISQQESSKRRAQRVDQVNGSCVLYRHWHRPMMQSMRNWHQWLKGQRTQDFGQVP